MLTIAIDYDGTLKGSYDFCDKECAMWSKIIKAFQEAGHSVFICTMRTGNAWDQRELSNWMEKADCALDVIYCGERGLKDEVCKSEGISVDIWIDDMPDMIRGNSWMRSTIAQDMVNNSEFRQSFEEEKYES